MEQLPTCIDLSNKICIKKYVPGTDLKTSALSVDLPLIYDLIMLVYRLFGLLLSIVGAVGQSSVFFFF